MLDPRRISLASKIIVTWSKSHPEFAGQTLDAIAKTLNCDLAEAANRLLPAGAIYFMMSEDDVRRVLAYRHTMIGSDGLPHDQHPHPRLWGTFPRVLGHYVREVRLFPLEEAVRRMTALPAAQFGLTDRGVLREGAYADLVLFDPETIADTATFEQPKTPAAGIACVTVDGAATGERPGRALRRNTLGPMGTVMPRLEEYQAALANTLPMKAMSSAKPGPENVSASSVTPAAANAAACVRQSCASPAIAKAVTKR
jgi:N-acyl-D-amino-acid deacylase